MLNLNTGFKVLTNKGFVSSCDLDEHKDLSIMLKSGLWKEYVPQDKSSSVTAYNKVKIVLATGVEFYVDKDSFLTGLTFNPEEIKNELESVEAKDFQRDDYIYTPTFKFSYYPEKKSINLSAYSNSPIKDKFRMYFISRDLYKKYQDYNFTTIEYLRYLKGKKVKDSTKQEIESYLKTINVDVEDSDALESLANEQILDNTSCILSDISPNKSLLDFIIVSMIRGKVDHNLVTEYINNPFILKTISYKFDKGNEHHEEMYENLLNFLRKLNIDTEERETKAFKYVSFVCEILINYYEEFVNSSFKELRKFSSVEWKYFLNTLYKYTNNSFYGTYESYLNLKEYAYYVGMVLNYNVNYNTNYNYPVVSNIVEETPITSLEQDDVIFLSEGYLTRIESVSAGCTLGPDDVQADRLIIG